jgi:hypothetical protein
LNRGPLSAFLEDRNSLRNIVIGTIIASLGINLIDDIILRFFLFQPHIVAIIGVGLSFASIWYFIRVMTAKRTQIRNYSGFFIVDYAEKKASL